MSVLEVRHEFFDVETRNNEQLYQAFCNHVYLGQWELTRICLQILYHQRLKLNTNLEDLLIDIIRNPTAYCTASKSVPTPFHFAFLLLEECRVKQYLDMQTIEMLKIEVIFKFLLVVGDIQPSSQVFQEFERLRTNTDAIPSTLLTDSMADFLVQLWLHDIPRVHTFTRLYLYSNIPAVHTWLVNIHKRALDICLQQMKNSNNNEQKYHLMDLLIALHFYACDTQEFRLTIRDTLKKVVIYATEANDNSGQIFNLKILYQTVLNNGYLARFISELESEYRRELLNNESVIIHFLKKNSFENERFFWKEIYLYLIENKIDLISCVLNDAILMIQNRDYSSLDRLLNLEQLTALHLYIFLLGWTHVRTINDALVLHNSMDTLKSKSSILEKCLKLFQSQIDFITWLHNVRRYHDGLSSLPNMSDLLALLHTNSPLSLIHRYLDVENIDSEEILEKLQKTMTDIHDENEKKNLKRQVRFPDDPDDDLLRLSQTSARMIFLGYLSINSVLHSILSSEQQIEITDDIFAKTRVYLTEIHPLRFRLEILENIFSLVFIQQNELKINETIESIEPSMSATSIAVSTPDKFLSSLQSNFTNDSILTSTNFSTKTQLSDRRFDRDFDVQSTDDASVCSSSVSSVSASHYGIYRTGLLIDQQILYQLLIFLRDHLAEIRTLNQRIQTNAIDRATVKKENSLDESFLGCSISNKEQFISRATKLNTILSETLWRYQLLTENKDSSIRQENRFDRTDNEENLLNNSAIKDLILPPPNRQHPRHRRNRSRLSSGSAQSLPSLSRMNSSSKSSSALVSQILSTRDNLLAICLKEGKITEANEVIRLLNMQDHPLAVEAKFSKLFRDTVNQLYNSYSCSTLSTETSNSNSALAGLANLASSALGNSSLQNDITPLLESAQLSTVSSTLPTSNYFDPDYFLSLTLFDLAINAPSISISKTLLDMSQHRLPLSRHLSSVNSSLHNPLNNKTSFSRIKTLHEMISNYLQLANISSNSLQDLLLDVTIPLDGIRATKLMQYYRRLEEHCRQYYINEEKSLSIEKQVKLTSELFENDPQAKLDLIAYVRNAPNQNKTSPSSTSYINYFSIFHTYLQNFHTLLEKFPIENLSTDIDFCKHSPLSLVHRIVARSNDIDLTQLQLMTSKLNIDISLAVSLNIIRPLFVDKTISTSSLSSTRQTTLLQQQPVEIFFNRQTSQFTSMSQSISNGSTRKQIHRSTTLLRRLTNKIDEFENESQIFNEHPEKFIRTLLTKLLDCIRKIIQESNPNRMTIEHIEKLIVLDDYDDIMNSLPLLTYIDLDQLTTNEERICFFTNFHNFFSIISHIELIRTASAQIQTSNIFRNELERILFLLTTRCDIGQLKQLSLYDIRHYFLKQTIFIDGLKFDIDPKSPFHHYAPTLTDHQHIQIGLLLNDCTITSAPLMILIPELLIEQLQRSTRDFIDKCVLIKYNDTNNSIQLILPNTLFIRFDQINDNLIKFIGEFSSNNQMVCTLNENRTINNEILPSRDEFSLNFDYHQLISQSTKVHRRRNSLPTSISNKSIPTSIDFLPSSTTLPNHLIDSRTISFVQEKSPALGQILQIYVQSIVHNQLIENDQTPLKSYFSSLLLSPTLIESTSSLGDEWFRSIVLNDLTYQHDLLLYLCSLLWNQSKYMEIVQLFDSLLPSFIVHSSYCQILRDLALLYLIKQTPKPDHAYNYLRKIHDCHLLVHATLTYLPRFDGPTCLKLLELCLTSCKKSHQDYVPWIQERLNAMYVYKTLCLGALAQFNKCMEKISKDEHQLNFSMEDMKIKKTSSKCLTWQRAEEHSQLDPLAVVDMFIYEKQFDMGHQWLNLLTNYLEKNLIDRVRIRLVEEHIHWLLKEENIGNGNRILQVIETVENPNDQWHLCTDLMNDLSKEKVIAYTKSIPFSKLFIKFRLIQYILGHFEENSEFFQGEYDRSKLCILVTGLALFFNCIPLEQTDSYVQLIGQPLLIVEQLLMNSSIDVAKTTIETLKILIDKYGLEKHIQVQQIDQLIEFYTKKSVQLNVALAHEEVTTIENKPPLSPVTTLQMERRASSAVSSSSSNRRKNSQEISPLGPRQNSGGSNNLLRTIGQRRTGKTPISSTSSIENDLNLSEASPPNTHSPPLSSSIPIKSNVPSTGSSGFGDYLSTSLSSRTMMSETGKQSTEFNLPIVAPSKKAWVSDDEVSVCMCCNETRFSMLNRRHHCRRCGRVVCKTCSPYMTMIKKRQERTCKDCYQHLQNSPTTTTTSRPTEPSTNPTKIFDSFRPPSKPISSSKRQSIGQLYLWNNPSADTTPSDFLFGTLTNDTPSILEENSLLYSSSFPTANPHLRGKKSENRTMADSPQRSDQTDTPTIPVVTDEVHYQLSGTSKDDAIRNDFHYDQSPSISLCLSLIELHSNQYQGGKLLINLCEYLSEQLSTKQRNMEIDYGLVLSIIKNLLFTAKMKLMTVSVEEEQIVEQQKLIASCDMYNNLVDILNRLNMANCSLPALNDLLQQDTLRKIRKQLLDDERYQLAMDVSTKCSLDTQTIWFQWGMAYLHIGQYGEARIKFDKCLQKNTETTDMIAKQQQHGGVSQEKMLNDIIEYLESSLPLKYAMKCQYLVEQQNRQAGQTTARLKYFHNLSTMPRLSDQINKVIDNEILFYLTTYSDDAHLLDYYIRHERYTEAFEYKSSLTSFRDHVYLPLLKRNHIKHLFNYILSRNNNNNPLTHHLRFVCTYLKEQEMYHSLQQLQLFMNDYTNAAYTSIKLFTANRTTYLDLFEKRLNYLQKAAEYFQHAKSDSEQTTMKLQSNQNKIDLQLDITSYIQTQLKRLNTNGSTIFVNCPTLFDGKEAVIKLIGGLITVSDTLANAFSLINRIIKEISMTPSEVFLPCAEDLGKRHDYRTLQQLLQLIRENGYTDNQLHDDIIETCILQIGSDVEQEREQDTLIQMIKNDDTRIKVYIFVGKLRPAYLIAIRAGREDKVRLICDEAEKNDQKGIYNICKKWLENRPSEQ